MFVCFGVRGSCVDYLQEMVPHAASQDDSGTTQSREWREAEGDTGALTVRDDSRFGHGAFKIQKKVLWDVHKLQRENAALLENMQKQCEHRERLQEQVAALRAKTKALEVRACSMERREGGLRLFRR